MKEPLSHRTKRVLGRLSVFTCTPSYRGRRTNVPAHVQSNLSLGAEFSDWSEMIHMVHVITMFTNVWSGMLVDSGRRLVVRTFQGANVSYSCDGAHVALSTVQGLKKFLHFPMLRGPCGSHYNCRNLRLVEDGLDFTRRRPWPV